MSRRSGAELISIIVPFAAAASITRPMSIAYGGRASILRPVGWPIASSHGWLTAAIMRSVIAFSSMPNEVWIEPITQSRRCSSSSA